MNFRFFMFCVEFCNFSENVWWNFVRISRQIAEKSDVCRFFNQICENKLEHCRNYFWNLWKLFNIIQYYSIVSLLLAPALSMGACSAWYIVSGSNLRSKLRFCWEVEPWAVRKDVSLRELGEWWNWVFAKLLENIGDDTDGKLAAQSLPNVLTELEQS